MVKPQANLCCSFCLDSYREVPREVPRNQTVIDSDRLVYRYINSFPTRQKLGRKRCVRLLRHQRLKLLRPGRDIRRTPRYRIRKSSNRPAFRSAKTNVVYTPNAAAGETRPKGSNRIQPKTSLRPSRTKAGSDTYPVSDPMRNDACVAYEAWARL